MFRLVAFFAVLWLAPAALRAGEMAVAAPEQAPQEAQAPSAKPSAKEVRTDLAIVGLIIDESRHAYQIGARGPCGCPEDLDRKGHRCGGRSAHTRPGGWTVYCYPSDITPEMISAYRASH
jgi:hypothetical protein